MGVPCCRSLYLTSLVSALLILAGLAELLVALSNFKDLWVTHTCLHGLGGVMCVLSGTGYMHLSSTPLSSRKRCEVLFQRCLLALTFLTQCVALLLLLVDRLGLVGLVLEVHGVDKVHTGDTWGIPRATHITAEMAADFRLLLIMSVIASFLVGTLIVLLVLCPLNHKHSSELAPISDHWVYSGRAQSSDRRPVLETTYTEGSERDVSAVRAASTPSLDDTVQLRSYRPLCSRLDSLNTSEPLNTTVGQREFIPLAELESQQQQQQLPTSLCYTVGRTATRTMSTFRPTPVSPEEGFDPIHSSSHVLSKSVSFRSPFYRPRPTTTPQSQQRRLPIAVDTPSPPGVVSFKGKRLFTSGMEHSSTGNGTDIIGCSNGAADKSDASCGDGITISSPSSRSVNGHFNRNSTNRNSNKSSNSTTNMNGNKSSNSTTNSNSNKSSNSTANRESNNTANKNSKKSSNSTTNRNRNKSSNSTTNRSSSKSSNSTTNRSSSKSSNSTTNRSSSKSSNSITNRSSSKSSNSITNRSSSKSTTNRNSSESNNSTTNRNRNKSSNSITNRSSVSNRPLSPAPSTSLTAPCVQQEQLEDEADASADEEHASSSGTWHTARGSS